MEHRLLNSFFNSRLGKFLKSKPKINYKKKNSYMMITQYKNDKFYILVNIIFTFAYNTFYWNKKYYNK